MAKIIMTDGTRHETIYKQTKTLNAMTDETPGVWSPDVADASKAAIMSNMHELLHNGWKLLDIPVQKHEFNTFISSQLPSGAWRLAADGDGHDDTVMGCGIGLWQVTNFDWLI